MSSLGLGLHVYQWLHICWLERGSGWGGMTGHHDFLVNLILIHIGFNLDVNFGYSCQNVLKETQSYSSKLKRWSHSN